MSVDDGFAYMIGRFARPIAITSLDYAAFELVMVLNSIGYGSKQRLHHIRDRRSALAQDNMQMVGHNRVGEELGVRSIGHLTD